LRHLGVANYGRYGTVMALLAVVQGVSDAGLGLTGSRELSMRRTVEERREMLGHLIGLRIILSAGGVLLAVAFAAVAGYTATMVQGTALAGAGIFVLSVQGALILPLMVELQNWKLALNDVVRQIILAACFVVLALTGASLLPFFGAQLLASIVVLLLTPLMLRREHLVRPRWVASQLRFLVVTTLPLAVAGTLIVIYFRLLVILMSVLERSAVQIGYYVTSERVIEILLNLPLMLVGVVVPVLSVASRDNAGRLQYVTFRMTQTMALIGVLLALVLATGARPILVLLGGKQYLGAADVLRIQGLAMITVFITGAWTTTLIGMGRNRALAVCSGIAVAAVGLLGGAFIPLWHARGAAIAAVAADVVYCISIYVPLRRAGATGLLKIGPFARMALCTIPGIVVAAVSPLPAAINCVIAAGAYVLLTVPLGVLPPELLDWTRRMRDRPAAPRDPGGPGRG
jgi:O-antigen/teichoic acid export membrane protein